MRAVPESTSASLTDRDIRQHLIPQLLAEHEPGTVLLEELGLIRHRARLDVATVNGTFHGYEIKSDRDSLRRLPSQIEVYNRVLEYCTVVTGERHLSSLLHEVPRWWGIRLAISGAAGEFVQIRRPQRNDNVDIRAQVELLWLDDALRLLAMKNSLRGFQNKPRHLVWDRVCELYEANEVSYHVRAHLKARKAQQAALSPS